MNHGPSMIRHAAFVVVLLLTTGCTRHAATTSPGLFADGVEPRLTNPKLAADTRELSFRTFTVLHSGVTRTPLWSAEHLTRASVQAAQARDARDNGFHAEARLPAVERAELDDYVHSGLDRGHMSPSGDMGDETSDRESFSLANMVPQAPALNRKSWARLEEYVRALTLKLGDAYVVTGPTFEGADLKRIGGRVLVPTSTWKALWVPGQGAGAWIATNTAAPKWQVMSVDQLAARIGVDPFPTLDAATRGRVPAFPEFGAGGTGRRRKR